MRYAQLRLTETEFIEVKKAALDAHISLEEFLKTAVFTQIKAAKLIASGIPSDANKGEENV